MKVFAISRGSYSDYRVLAVFSTREKAEAWLPFVSSDYEEPFVEDFEFDPEVPVESGMTVFRVSSDTDLLTVVRVVPEERIYDFGVQCYGSFAVVCVMARDVEHATKIAADKFREYKAVLMQNAQAAMDREGEKS